MPDVSDELRTEILYQLLNYFSLKTTYSSLADLLVAQKRISLLPLILTRINEEYKDSTNSMEFSVESTLDLNSQEIEELKKFLSQKTGKHITLTFTKNPLLIAGIKLYSRQ
jgi:F0F1-type ATP synthase delta subunit